MKYLAIDYGTTKMGLATADSEMKMAIPRPMFFYKKIEQAINNIKELTKQEGIDKIIIGLPLSLNSQETEISQKIRNFAEILKKEVDISIDFENEILSTQEAVSNQESFLGKIKTRSFKFKINPKNLDSQSAAIILQSYLNKK